jgi:hypothetical protein
MQGGPIDHGITVEIVINVGNIINVPRWSVRLPGKHVVFRATSAGPWHAGRAHTPVSVPAIMQKGHKKRVASGRGLIAGLSCNYIKLNYHCFCLLTPDTLNGRSPLTAATPPPLQTLGWLAESPVNIHLQI